MSTELADAPVFGRPFKRQWATATTSTTTNELPEISMASAAASQPDVNLFCIALPYAPSVRALPPNIGRVVPIEGVLEQVGNIEDAISTSHILPVCVFSTGSLGWAFHVSSHRMLVPSPVHREEMVNWDVAIEVAPKRPSGKLTVTLRYAGRGTPSPIENPWDDE